MGIGEEIKIIEHELGQLSGLEKITPYQQNILLSFDAELRSGQKTIRDVRHALGLVTHLTPNNESVSRRVRILLGHKEHLSGGRVYTDNHEVMRDCLTNTRLAFDEACKQILEFVCPENSPVLGVAGSYAFGEPRVGVFPFYSKYDETRIRCMTRALSEYPSDLDIRFQSSFRNESDADYLDILAQDIFEEYGVLFHSLFDGDYKVTAQTVLYRK